MKFNDKINNQVDKAADVATEPLRRPDADHIFQILLDRTMKRWNKLSQGERDAAMEAQVREDWEADMMRDSYK